MLLRPRPTRDLAHKTPPFLASVSSLFNEEGEKQTEVSFEKGKIFQCYNNSYQSLDGKEQEKEDGEEKEVLVEGSKFHYPKNISEKFTFKDKDKFYIRPDKFFDQSEIIKVAEGDNTEDGDILIWEAGDEEQEISPKQYLSSHVYLQNIDEYRQQSFTKVLLEKKKDGSKRYRFNGGWFIMKDMAIYEFIPSFEYTLEEGQERYFYIQTEAAITAGKPENWANSNRKFIKKIKALRVKNFPDGAEVQYSRKKVALIYFDNNVEITQQFSQSVNNAYIGKDCARTPQQRSGAEFGSLVFGSVDARELHRISNNKSHGVYLTPVAFFDSTTEAGRQGGDIYRNYAVINETNTRIGRIVGYQISIATVPPRVSHVFVSAAAPFNVNCKIPNAKYYINVLAFDKEKEVGDNEYEAEITRGGIAVGADQIPDNSLSPDEIFSEEEIKEFNRLAQEENGGGESGDEDDEEEIEKGDTTIWTIYGELKPLGKEYEVLKVEVPSQYYLFVEDEDTVRSDIGKECDWQQESFGGTNTFYEFVEARFHQVTSELVIVEEDLGYNQNSSHDGNVVLGLEEF
tara:strand:+ start:5177 stop:6886 length:1710 start_codon:yes stop_codon:yes gene_type:complete